LYIDYLKSHPRYYQTLRMDVVLLNFTTIFNVSLKYNTTWPLRVRSLFLVADNWWVHVEGALLLLKLMPQWWGNLTWKAPPLLEILPRTLNRTFLGIWVVCLTPTSNWVSFLEQPHSEFSPMLVWYRLLNIPTTCLDLLYNFVSPTMLVLVLPTFLKFLTSLVLVWGPGLFGCYGAGI